MGKLVTNVISLCVLEYQSLLMAWYEDTGGCPGNKGINQGSEQTGEVIHMQLQQPFHQKKI